MNTTDTLLVDARKLIAKHEGLRLHPYYCSANKLTIGFGRNLDDNGITIQEAQMMLDKDVAKTHDQLANFAWFNELNYARKIVLIDMCFNLGFTRLQGFRKMIQALCDHDYMRASAEMRNSKWSKQVGLRSETLIAIMRNGFLQYDV